MPKFVSYISNGVYYIGFTGRTVYVYDKNGKELAKFKDLTYAYYAVMSPCGDMFVLKSTDGRLAVYSLETLSLIKKFRFSKVNYSQDDGACFSADGKYFINIERQGDDLHSAISIYDVIDFSRVSLFTLGDSAMIGEIERVDGEFYVLGFWRDADFVITENFVAKFKEGKLYTPVNITPNEYAHYSDLFLNKRNGGIAEEKILATAWEISSK